MEDTRTQEVDPAENTYQMSATSSLAAEEASLSAQPTKRATRKVGDIASVFAMDSAGRIHLRTRPCNIVTEYEIKSAEAKKKREAAQANGDVVNASNRLTISKTANLQGNLQDRDTGQSLEPSYSSSITNVIRGRRQKNRNMVKKKFTSAKSDQETRDDASSPLFSRRERLLFESENELDDGKAKKTPASKNKKRTHEDDALDADIMLQEPVPKKSKMSSPKPQLELAKSQSKFDTFSFMEAAEGDLI